MLEWSSKFRQDDQKNSHFKLQSWFSNITKVVSPSVRVLLQITDTSLASLRKKRFIRYLVVYKIPEGAGGEVLGLRVQAEPPAPCSFFSSGIGQVAAAAAGNHQT